jgi:N-acetylmuramoyl-L-alanine amidase
VKSVYLSAGHSNADPGACANGRREADIAVEFRNLVAFYLQRAGVEHELDGSGTENYPLARAAAEARTHDVAVEFHCNAAATLASGCEALSAPEDARLSAKLTAAVSGALGIRDRGAKPENAGQHTKLAFVRAGGIILELLFITNSSDIRAYDSRKWLAAKAVADVLRGA